MSSISYHKNSPFYYLRYYDKNEPDPKKRRKSIPTKIPISKADLKLIEEAKLKGLKKIKLNGSRELLDRKKEVDKKILLSKISEAAQFEENTPAAAGLFSVEFDKYIKKKTVYGDPGAIKPKTKENYETAGDHLIKCCGDRNVLSYTEADFNALLGYFEDLRLAYTSRSIYLRSLRALWNDFVKNNLVPKCVFRDIEYVQDEDGEEEDEADPIPLDELGKILKYFKKKEYQTHFNFIYATLLTACRPSSIVVQQKEWILPKDGYMKIRNVKARKKKKFFNFPLYPELKKFLTKNFDLSVPGRLFPQFHYDEYSYTQSLKFWQRGIDYLIEEKIITQKYQMKQLRPTFASYAANELKIPVDVVSELLNHTDRKITDRHYVKFQMQTLSKMLSKAKFGKFVS